MTEQQKSLNETVVVTLEKASTSAIRWADENPSPTFVDETDFLNGVADLVRAHDPEALKPGYFVQGSIKPQHIKMIFLNGDAAKIADALQHIFNGRAGRENITASVAPRVMESVKVYKTLLGDDPSTARQVTLTVAKPLLAVVREGNLPVRVRGPGL
jgi:hypothetical protein